MTNMEPAVKPKNIGKAEAILRYIIGAVLIILAYFSGGILRWVFGLIGVAFILTVLFGY